jgi:hypothetical protein
MLSFVTLHKNPFEVHCAASKGTAERGIFSRIAFVVSRDSFLSRYAGVEEMKGGKTLAPLGKSKRVRQKVQHFVIS